MTVDEETARIQILAEEYIALVEAMRNGEYADMEEWQRMSSERTLIHDELIERTGVTDRSKMYGYCRTLLNH